MYLAVKCDVQIRSLDAPFEEIQYPGGVEIVSALCIPQLLQAKSSSDHQA
jgi:hypothetical protein